MRSWNEPSKRAVSRELFSEYNNFKTNPAEAYLCMPSLTCYDVFELYDQGQINKNTKIFAVECDWHFLQDIKEKLSHIGFKNFHIHKGDLFGLKVNDIVKAGFKKFDLVYLDTCSNISKHAYWWMPKFRKMITANTTVMQTWAVYRGTSSFLSGSKRFEGVEMPKDHKYNFGKNSWLGATANWLEKQLRFKTVYGRGYKRKGNGGPGCGGAPMFSLKLLNLGRRQGPKFSGSENTLNLGYI